jgi:hypothetical protein
MVIYLFLYFYAEVETNIETPKTYTKTDTFGNRYEMNTDEKRMIIETKRLPKSCKKYLSKLSKSKNFFPKPITITRCN